MERVAPNGRVGETKRWIVLKLSVKLPAYIRLATISSLFTPVPTLDERYNEEAGIETLDYLQPPDWRTEKDEAAEIQGQRSQITGRV